MLALLIPGTLVLALLAAAPAAQVVPVPNTGCPNYPYVNAAASGPRLGQPFGWMWNCSGLTINTYTVFGTVPANRTPFGPPLTCVPGPCNLYVAPLLLLGGAPRNALWLVNIPNDPALIGTVWAIQAGCFSPSNPSCFDLSGAVTATVQR